MLGAILAFSTGALGIGYTIIFSLVATVSTVAAVSRVRLGVTDYQLFESRDCEAYRRDVARATERIENEIYEGRIESYEEERRDSYQRTLAAVEERKSHGEPLIPEKYRDVIEALRVLGRNTEAEALAHRALKELQGADDETR